MGVDFILWDHDGVLVDTEPLFFEATRRTLEAWGVELSREHWLHCQARGLGLAQVVATRSPVELDVVAIRRGRDDLYEQLLDGGDVWIDGARDVLIELSARYRMALVTTSRRRFIEQLHGATSALDHFEHVITADDCSRHKPDPEPYLRAMEVMGAHAARTVAVEDSPRGLASARRAGIRCIIVRSEFMSGSDLTGADAVLADVRDLPTRLARDGTGSP